MFAQLAFLLRPILEQDYIWRVRRNHALEHATVHMLNRQRVRLSGRASGTGFVLYGDVPTDKVQQASKEALMRMKRGEKHWAIHPNCGTNLVATGFLLALVGVLVFGGTSRRAAWERFPLAMVGMMLASVYSLPFGMALQKHFTTSSDMGALTIVAVRKRTLRLPIIGVVTVHEVVTQNP